MVHRRLIEVQKLKRGETSLWQQLLLDEHALHEMNLLDPGVESFNFLCSHPRLVEVGLEKKTKSRKQNSLCNRTARFFHMVIKSCEFTQFLQRKPLNLTIRTEIRHNDITFISPSFE